MFVINRKSKRGGFWDNKSKKVVEQITTDDAEKAEEYKNHGYSVTTVEDKKSKSPKTKNTKNTAEESADEKNTAKEAADEKDTVAENNGEKADGNE